VGSGVVVGPGTVGTRGGTGLGPVAGSIAAGPVVVRFRPWPDPEAAWAASGAMSLTGRPDGPPLGTSLPLIAAVEGAVAVIRLLAALRGRPFELDAPALLAERAALAGLTRGGRSSAGGAARLLAARDGWLAVNLPRTDDLDLLPAWLGAAVPEPERSGPTGPTGGVPDSGVPDGGAAGGVGPRRAGPPEAVWRTVGATLAGMDVGEAVELAAPLGLAVAAVGPPPGDDEQAAARGQRAPYAPFLVDGQAPGGEMSAGRMSAGGMPGVAPGGGLLGGGLLGREPGRDDGDRDGGRPGPPRRPETFTVVDFSSLWAGPLCAHLLGLAGARVVKVEGAGRLDGARFGPPAFFDLLHAGQASVTVDLTGPTGRRAARELIVSSDVVIEASRPRAFDQLGLAPAALLAECPGLTWVSITGYGRTGPWRDRVAFGDDAAAAAGLVAWEPDGSPLFVADAVADPLTGIVAAAAALACVLGGGGHHVDIALREVVASLLTGPEPEAGCGDGGWDGDGDRDGPAGRPRFAPAADHARPPAPPRARRPAGTAPPPGADNAIILAATARPGLAAGSAGSARAAGAGSARPC
jgi:hypothetical protein